LLNFEYSCTYFYCKSLKKIQLDCEMIVKVNGITLNDSDFFEKKYVYLYTELIFEH